LKRKTPSRSRTTRHIHDLRKIEHEGEDQSTVAGVRPGRPDRQGCLPTIDHQRVLRALPAAVDGLLGRKAMGDCVIEFIASNGGLSVVPTEMEAQIPPAVAKISVFCFHVY
jgi:hypothetical protein